MNKADASAPPARGEPALPGVPQGQPFVPRSDFRRRVEEASGVDIGACFGCKKCSNGCPLAWAMDLHPYQVVRYVQLGLEKPLQQCLSIWVCASCQTCYTRCPNQVDLPRFMDHLKELVHKGGLPPAHQRSLLFHRLFLREIKARGRVFEASLMTRYMLASGGAFGPEAKENARLGLAMLRKGRLRLLPSRVKDRRWLKALFAESAEEMR